MKQKILLQASALCLGSLLSLALFSQGQETPENSQETNNVEEKKDTAPENNNKNSADEKTDSGEQKKSEITAPNEQNIEEGQGREGNENAQPELEEPKPEPEKELSEEEKQMQAIEPGFVPPDERAIKLFLLEKVVKESEDSLKEKKEETRRIRGVFQQKFLDDLSDYANKALGEREEKFKGLIDQQIVYYETALRNLSDNRSEAAQLMYNLGLLRFEQEENRLAKELAEYNDARERGEEDVPYPEEDFSGTIDLYEEIMEKYSDFELMDHVYYLHALGLWFEGAFYNAVDQFQALINKFPKSRFVDEIWFRLGEYFYDMDEYDEAVDAYSRIAKNKKSQFYDKALYKIAWAHFQKDRFALAIENFNEVLTIEYKKRDVDHSVGVSEEVTRYIVRSFSDQLLQEEEKFSRRLKKDEEKEYSERLGERLVDRVVAHFKAMKYPKYTRAILIKTAALLVDEGKINGAIKAFEAVMRLDRNHEDNPRYASQIVDILDGAGRDEEARAKNQELIRRYRKGSAWSKKMERIGNIKALKYARETVRDAMLALAVYYHKTGKDLKEAKKDEEAKPNFRRAAALYLRYIKEYAERDDTHKAIFYFAESAYELKRYKTALDAYTLLKQYPLPIPGTFRRDATFNIVFTFRYVIEQEAKRERFKEIDFEGLTSKSKGQEKEEIPKIGLQYLEAIEEFLKMAPNDEQVPVLLFHAGAIYYVYGHSDEALSRFMFIVDTYPKTAAGIVAGRLLLDDLIAKEDWLRVAELAKRFKDQDLGGQKNDFARIEGNAKFKIARAIFEEANELQKQNQLSAAKVKYKEASDKFLQLLKEDPQNPYADIMLFNSARAIVQSGTTTQALPLYKRLYTEYPKSEYAKTARFQEALAFEKMLLFSAAALAYDGIFKLDPKSEAAGDALLNKALLYEAAGEDKKAADAFTDFAKRYPKRPEAPDALLTTASIYKKMGRTTQQISMLERFIRQYKNDKEKIPAVIEAHVQIADTYDELSQKAKGTTKRRYDREKINNYKKAVALYSKELNSPIAAYYAAKSQMILEKSEQDSFKKLKINGRLGKTQSDQLTKMMKRLTELSAKNEAIIAKYAQPVWNAESLLRIGSLYEHLAKSMISAPCPRDVARIDEFACEEYIVLLEDKAAVLEQKALDAYKQSYEIAMSAFDAPESMVNRIQIALNRLRPGEYQRPGKVIERPRTGKLNANRRMLSDGRMASSLHPDESDPDIAKKEVVEPEVEETTEPEGEPALEGELLEEAEGEDLDEVDEEEFDEEDFE